MLFVHFFDAFVLPRIMASNGIMRAWDNLSKDWIFDETNLIHGSYKSASACERFCRESDGCLQWAWSPGRCRGGRTIRLGWALNDRPELDQLMIELRG